MQGLYLPGYKRPRSKKEVIEVCKQNQNIVLEATSMFGNEYDGGIDNAPDGEYHFVGPCPYTNRKFYGTIVKANGKLTVK